jgi:hypothetical protein
MPLSEQLLRHLVLLSPAIHMRPHQLLMVPNHMVLSHHMQGVLNQPMLLVVHNLFLPSQCTFKPMEPQLVSFNVNAQ